MIAKTSNAYRDALVRWTASISRLAWPVVLVSLLVSVLAGFYLADNVRINTDTEDMLSPDLEFRRLNEELDAAFPQFSDNILVVIDGATADVADDTARLLAARLRQSPKQFGRVQDPAGNDFFRKNGFLFLDVDALNDLSDRLADAQPFLGALWRDPSMVGFFRVLGLAMDEMLKESKNAPIDIAPVLDAITDVAEAQAAGKYGQLSWQDLMSGPPAAEDRITANRRVLIIQPALSYDSLAPAGDALAALRQIIGEMELTPENGVRVRLTGSAALSHEELQSVEKGMGLAGIVSFVLVIGLLMIGLGSKRLVAATLLTLVMGLIWTAAFAILALGTLNLISVAFAVLFIGLSVDFGIHYGLRYKEAINRGADHADALSETAAHVGGALTLCALSAAIAFYSFLPTDYLGLAELGLIAGTGMFIAFFANITILPALLTVMPVLKPRTHGKGGFGLALHFASVRPMFRSFINLNSRAVCWAALAVGMAAALALPKASFDFDPLNLKDPKTESVATIFDLMADSRASPYSISILMDNLESARTLAKKIAALPEVDAATTIADYVPTEQEEKLEIISSMALFLGPSFAGDSFYHVPTPYDHQVAMRDFRIRLAKLSALKGGEAKAARRLDAALAGLVGAGPYNNAKLKALEKRLLNALPGRLDGLRAALQAEPVSLASLPADITEGQVSKDGKVRLEVYAKGNLRERKILAGFVTAVRATAPKASGSSVVILEAGNTVIKAFWQAGAISISLISVLLIVVLGRWRDAMLVFAPLVLAALLSVSAGVVFDLPFNFANIIVLPLLFGLGVASGIHLVLREREEHGVSAVLDTSTPRAVVFSALTTIGSFASIALSSHPGTSSMGQLLSIAIALTLGCTLVVLPALMNVTAKNGDSTG